MNTTAHTLTNTQQHDSTYHYEHDSMAIAYLRAIPQSIVSHEFHTAGMLPAATSFESCEGFGFSNGSNFVPPDTLVVERWHTRYRDRVVVKTDTVYQDKETTIQLPPERYVPRTVRCLAWIGAIVLLTLVLRLMWRMKGV